MKREDLVLHDYYVNIKTGKLYLLIDFVKHSEDLSELVLYQSATTDQVWVRPLELFLEKFRPEDEDDS